MPLALYTNSGQATLPRAKNPDAAFIAAVERATQERFFSHLTRKLKGLSASGGPAAVAEVEKRQVCDFDIEETWASIAELESRHVPKMAKIAERQTQINQKTSKILFDWLVDVVDEYKLSTQTLELAINYTLRYLELKKVERRDFQKLGVAALMMAARYEEIAVPNVDEFAYVTDNTYSKREILDSAQDLNNTLSMEYHAITPGYVLSALLSEMDADPAFSHRCSYLLHEYYVNGRIVSVPPTKLAAAVILTALRIDSPPAIWPIALQKRAPFLVNWAGELDVDNYKIYERKELTPLITMLDSLWKNRRTNEQRAAFNLFSTVKYSMVAQ